MPCKARPLPPRLPTGTGLPRILPPPLPRILPPPLALPRPRGAGVPKTGNVGTGGRGTGAGTLVSAGEDAGAVVLGENRGCPKPCKTAVDGVVLMLCMKARQYATSSS